MSNANRFELGASVRYRYLDAHGFEVVATGVVAEIVTARFAPARYRIMSLDGSLVERTAFQIEGA